MAQAVQVVDGKVRYEGQTLAERDVTRAEARWCAAFAEAVVAALRSELDR